MWRVAASPGPHRDRAQALWPTISLSCRGGAFFLAAAEIASFARDTARSTTDGVVVVHSPADALTQGLASEPDHPGLLSHLALVGDLAPDLQAPPLPADACARAKGRGAAWADDAAYVCAMASIRDRDGSTALVELERIHDVGRFPDLEARRVQSLALAGKQKEARALAKTAAVALDRGLPFDVPDAAVAAFKKKLAVL